MKREQERREKIEREEGTGRRGPKARAETDIAMTISVTKEATASSAGDNRAYSDGGNRKDKHGGGKRIRIRCRDSSKTGSLCNGGRSGEELLCLQRIWTYGPSL